MKTKNLLWLFVSLFLLAIPAVQTSAFDDEVEIELMEVSGFLPGDNPLDDPINGGGEMYHLNPMSSAQLLPAALLPSPRARIARKLLYATALAQLFLIVSL